MLHEFDVAVIGAGPSGALAATLLNKQGFNVCVLEKQHFPRFVIGESLLPYAMDLLAEAGLAQAVTGGTGFQTKNGVAFTWGSRYAAFEFADKACAGGNTALQVYRSRFDHLLIQEAERQGVQVRFGESVKGFNNEGERAVLDIETDRGQRYTLSAAFVLDASGYGRALPRLLDWDIPSELPPRQVHYTHIDDRISDSAFDRNKTLIATHPHFRDVWLWLTPFADGQSSIGVVGESWHFDPYASSREILQKYAGEVPMLARILHNAEWENDVPFIYLRSYSAGIKALHGRHFAVLGNAAEFLDPVFSSGVTIALHSAKLAAGLVARHLYDSVVDWDREFTGALAVGTRTFRTLVEGWYDNRFQNVVYSNYHNAKVHSYLSGILAGFAWDESNPFVCRPEEGLQALADRVGDLSLS